ncbi:SDR family NAD(P)-dependent oxidoreductase [Rhodococcus sp. T2V]|uniref:SDR family NAD(P)-dependent oxidoreductase n=1 Tax=Rhodococcus sp. T2V TaxID=3034164 RepID=UPI0023E13102|nr:SDR family oxidoreductase [Rhodococcus sp. T2V]MDF3306450.1 SDR family NAD(P)-dependent oxidoreductase [Rhodococcus sp. T2V]
MSAPVLSPRRYQLRGVVTGAASGIGRACLELLVEHGAHVDAWDRSPEALADLPTGDAIATRRTDVTDPDSVADSAHEAKLHWGGIDFVVNCAGAFLVGPLADVSVDAVRKLFDLNVLGTTIVTQALLPALVASKGSIVNVASTVALKPSVSNSHYAASKAAVAHLTRCWALELGPKGVRVNSVAPGPTTTPLFRAAGMSAEQETEMLRERAATIPLRRVGEPDETARWIARFALEDSWTTGAVLPVDGGMSL